MTLTRFFDRILSAPAHDVSPTRDSSVFVRETFYASSTDIIELLLSLRQSRTTGRLILDMRDGGVSVIRVREEVEFNPG
jgi:hypothetical protein